MIKKLPLKAAALVIAAPLLLTACGGQPDGYYDPAGNYHVPGGTGGSQNDDRYQRPWGYRDGRIDTDRDGYIDGYAFDRRGYYDWRGYYVEEDLWPDVPARYFPRRGMCRVWFPDRPFAAQPKAVPCNRLRYGYPEGTYVIYGG